MEGIMSSKLFTTRQGTILLGVIAAVIAAVALIIYLHAYRNSVNSANAKTQVLIAPSLIQAGTPGDVIKSSGLYRIVEKPKSSVAIGALAAPSSLTGLVATTDIAPGDVLTAADFAPATNSLTEQLNQNQRAVVVPLGSPQQVGGQISAGSHVDVWVSLNGTGGAGASTKPTVELFLQDVYVLGASGDNVTLRATARQAGQLIYASENSQLWLVLRPTIGSTQSKPPLIKGLG